GPAGQCAQPARLARALLLRERKPQPLATVGEMQARRPRGVGIATRNGLMNLRVLDLDALEVSVLLSRRTCTLRLSRTGRPIVRATRRRFGVLPPAVRLLDNLRLR